MGSVEATPHTQLAPFLSFNSPKATLPAVGMNKAAADQAGDNPDD
jgi:hypothetical protein